MRKKIFFRILLFAAISIIIFLPVIFPLFHKGFFLTDDGEWMIIRFSAFYQALADGQFPVRFLHRLNFDYGYPVATFLYPGFMYAAVPFAILKIGFTDAIKFILGTSLIGTTVFTYLWLSHIFKKKISGVTGAVVSLYLPYHLYDVYTRGSVGEVFALTWVAFILWMIEKRNLVLVSIGIALLLISHNSLALLFLPFLFIYALIRKIALKKLFISFVLGFSLSAFFIIPAFFELSFTNFSQTKISNPIQYFANIELLGFGTLLIFAFALILLFSKKKLVTGHKLLISFFLFATFLSIIFSTSFSSVFWQFFPSSFIQFPFRLLSYLVITLAFLSAFVISEIQAGIKRIILFACLAGVIIFSSTPFLTPKVYFDKGEGYYFTNDATTTVQDEYMPVWVKTKPLQRAEKKVEIIKGKGSIENISYNNTQTVFSITANEPVHLKINTLYWPGWRIFVNNKETVFSYENSAGVIELDVPTGTHQVRVSFSETPLRLFADVISIVSIGLLLLIIFRFKHLK